MAKNNKKITLKMAIMIAMAVALMIVGAVGTYAVTRSAKPFESEEYKGWFTMNHLEIHLLENGRDVCDGKNDLDGSGKVTGDLVQYLGYKDGTAAGTVEPGMVYDEQISALNGQDIPVYLRMAVRKYWLIDGTGEKATDLSPAWIGLKFGDKAYNDTAWVLDDSETTKETSVYYYRRQLEGNAATEPLFDRLCINSDVKQIESEEVTHDEDTGVTTHTFTYKYDGYTFMIQADVQAIQTHNAEDAIHSQWGVYNVSVQDEKLIVE